MAISWTIIVLGALLQGMQCNADDGSTTALPDSTLRTTADATTADSTTVPLTSSSSTKPNTSSASLDSATLTTPPASSEPTKSVTSAPFSESTTLTTTLTTLEPAKPATPSSSPDSSTQAPTTKATSPDQTVPSSTVAKQDQATTVITTNPNQGTTNLNRPATTISTDVVNTQLLSTQTNPSAVAKYDKLPTIAAPDSKSTASQSLGTTKAQTTTVSITPGQRNENITTSTSTPQKSFNHSFDLSSSTERNIVYDACKTLGQKMKGNCLVTMKIQDKRLIATVTINADQKIPLENYKPLEPASGVTNNKTLQKENLNKKTIPDTLIAILASCGALVLILCCFAAYCTYHRRSYRKNQQHLTEELQTVENGYHDNPTLEVMEVQPEMQEKKLTLNGEFNDSWIVPIDNLLKEDIPDEEDTHL